MTLFFWCSQGSQDLTTEKLASCALPAEGESSSDPWYRPFWRGYSVSLSILLVRAYCPLPRSDAKDFARSGTLARKNTRLARVPRYRQDEYKEWNQLGSGTPYLIKWVEICVSPAGSSIRTRAMVRATKRRDRDRASQNESKENVGYQGAEPTTTKSL